MIRRFKNKKTGKTMILDSDKDVHLICSLESNDEWQELIYT
jgi:hypothetical protein